MCSLKKSVSSSQRKIPERWYVRSPKASSRSVASSVHLHDHPAFRTGSCSSTETALFSRDSSGDTKVGGAFIRPRTALNRCSRKWDNLPTFRHALYPEYAGDLSPAWENELLRQGGLIWRHAFP
jgi:hypothetical protein